MSTALAGAKGPPTAWLLLLACCLLPGCAALTNPVANGIPVRLLPEELLAPSREGFEQIPLTLLRQPPPKSFRLDAGDTLGVYIDGVLGSAETPPPVNLPSTPELPPSIGYPIPIRADGTVNLPLVGALSVAGMTIDQAERTVIDAYTKPRDGAPGAEQDQGYLREDTQILVTLMRPRHVRVVVVRDDSQQRQVSLRNESLLGLGATETTIGGGERGVGQVLELPAYENDVLNALARTGGLPGLESTHEVVIQRGYWNQPPDADDDNSPAADATPADGMAAVAAPRVTRIPLRVRPGEPLGFRPEDVILNTGDILTVRARLPEFFYTGGLLPAAEHPLPNDYDLTALEAVLKSRGPLFNGGLNTSNLNGAVIAFGIGNPSPNLLSVLRKTAGGGQVTIRVDLDEAARDPRQDLLVQAGDVLILQEAPDQAMSRYMTTIFQGNIFTRFLNRGDATGTASVSVP
ncbi:MAG: polysaccharide biosynthesis/export family protein [Pirellulales bacterium]|nr:polysaccharide biosynthesis/export family protein [Pirellulales bacterium]